MEKLTTQKINGLLFLKKARELGVISEERIQRYIDQALKAIEGASEPPVIDPAQMEVSPGVGSIPAPPPEQVEEDEDEGPGNLRPTEFLQEKGIDPETIRRFASLFGRRLKTAYINHNGVAPQKGTNGASRGACVYTEEDLPLFESVYKGTFNGVRLAEITNREAEQAVQ